jgi:uncharacterized protein
MNGMPRQLPALGRVLLFLLCCAIVLAATAPFASRLPAATQGIVIGTVASLGAFALTVLFLRWDGLRLNDIGAAFNGRSPLRLAIGFGLGLLIVALHASIVAVVGHVRWVRVPSVGVEAIAINLVAFLCLSCREELAFHGYPLRRLQSLFGVWVAQAIVALVFAAEHVAGGSAWGQALVGAGVGSLLFGMASIATRGLAVPIGLHAAWNLGDWMRGGKATNGPWRQVIEDGFAGRASTAATIGYVVVMGATTLAFWWWYRASTTGLTSGSSPS